MANSSSPWADYHALMACCLVALDKRPGVRPVGIGETLCRDLAKLVMRAAGDRAKMACGNIQLCAGLEASFARDRQSVSPIPTGCTPGLLSSATRRHAISAQYATQGVGKELSTQSARVATTTLSFSDAHLKRRGQFRSSIASVTSVPAVLESFDATNVTLSFMKYRGTVSGTSSYSSKDAHVGFSTEGTRMSQ